ncbi:MAG: phosphorelay protein [Thalassotalea sp.]|nr:phosphorelay protein [Thalassotalea sp.]
MNSINQLDTDLLTGYVENLGKDIVQQMLDLYIQQSVVYLRDINEAITECSQPLWQDHCHKMKGATGSVGLTLVHAKLVTIEKSTDDWNVKESYINELSELNNEAIASFTAWLSEQS